MTCSLRSVLGRAACVIGLALAAQFAYAGQLCAGVAGLARSVDAHAVAEECCGAASIEPAGVCALDPRHLKFGIGGVSPSVEHTPLAVATDCAPPVAAPASLNIS